jgi:hypothetical protein
MFLGLKDKNSPSERCSPHFYDRFFSELGVVDGVIIARTDSLGASLTQKIPVVKKLGDLPSRLVILTFLNSQITLKRC